MRGCAHLSESKCFYCPVRIVPALTAVREHSLIDRELTIFFFYFAVSLRKRLCPMSPSRPPSTLGTASLPAAHPAPHLRTPQVT